MSPTRTAEAFAPAKINLTLHVTGRRPDGYHLLDSLVVFAGIGDRVTARPADRLILDVTGPMAAGVPVDGTNLVLRAAAAMGVTGARITLEKHLPAAAGIGGGSSDAAAAMRALARLTGRGAPVDGGLSLGADLPVCLTARPARMAGIGDVVTPLDGLPALWAVLVNPRSAVPTGAVFAALERSDNAPMPADLPRFADAASLAGWLAGQRNDLEPPARAILPAIGSVLSAIGATRGCLLVRMSGSGATCFGLYAHASEAEAAAASLAAAHRDWWIAAAPILSAPP